MAPIIASSMTSRVSSTKSRPCGRTLKTTLYEIVRVRLRYPTPSEDIRECGPVTPRMYEAVDPDPCLLVCARPWVIRS